MYGLIVLVNEMGYDLNRLSVLYVFICCPKSTLLYLRLRVNVTDNRGPKTKQQS